MPLQPEIRRVSSAMAPGEERRWDMGGGIQVGGRRSAVHPGHNALPRQTWPPAPPQKPCPRLLHQQIAERPSGGVAEVVAKEEDGWRAYRPRQPSSGCHSEAGDSCMIAPCVPLDQQPEVGGERGGGRCLVSITCARRAAVSSAETRMRPLSSSNSIGGKPEGRGGGDRGADRQRGSGYAAK